MSDYDEDLETKWSPAGFEAPSPEVEDTPVVCIACGETAPASEMGVTADEKITTEADELIKFTRRYVCDGDCMVELLESNMDAFEQIDDR